MNWIKQFVIPFVFTCGLMVRSSFGIPSKLQPAEKFEFCVARNLTESSLFNIEDKVRMSKIVMETDLRMHELKVDPDNPANTKTMLRLFAAALACVVADCDSSARSQRERACLTAIEACAKSLKEPSGGEVAQEIKKIFSAINREISTLDLITHNSASIEVKTKERLEKETNFEKKETSGETKAAKKEHSEAKERPKRANVPSFRYQPFGTPLQSNPTLDSIIADKLLRSNTFKNFFIVGLPQEDAIFFSRSMVSSGLNGYRYDIIDEAMNAVTNAMYRLGTFAGTRDYAFAIGRSIASVLSAHELLFYADGLGIGSSLVYQLDSMLGSDSSSSLPLPPSFGTVSVSSSGWGSSSAAISGQVRGMASAQGNPSFVEPSFGVPANPQKDKTQFQNRLAYSLSMSEKISGAFCSGPFPGLYEIMNSAFANYGYQVASTIADVVSNSLNMLPTEAACTQYPEVISNIVADILDNNGLVLAADPQTIANKISDLIKPDIQSNPPQNPPGIGSQTSSGSDYQLNPSFTDYSYSAPENPPLPDDQYPDSGIPSSGQNVPVQQEPPVQVEQTKLSIDASPPIIQTPNKQDVNLPTKLRSDGEYSPDSSSLSADDSTTTNNSWVIVDSPSDVSTALERANQTSSSIDVAPPIILEPGPVIPENIPTDTGIVSEPRQDYPKETKTTPKMRETTKIAERTTPVPLSTNFQPSTVMVVTELTTSAPQVALKDAFESTSKLSEFLMEQIKPSLKALNATSDDQKKQPDITETSTEVKIPQIVDSPLSITDTKPSEKSSDSQDKPSSDPTSTEVQPSEETPQQQNGSPADFILKAPEPITDEVTALLFGERVSAIVTSAIGLIRSESLQLDVLCNRLNQLAPLVDIPPLDVCAEIPLIDYLLHAMDALTIMLVGE